MIPHTVLLFDMDGVLVQSQGYHRALQQTVAWMAEALGYRGAELTGDDIAFIESLGISSEWESAAICSALLMAHGWRQGLDLQLPARLPDPQPPHGLELPPLRAFFEQLGPLQDARSALASLESALKPGEEQGADPELLRKLLHSARSPESLTHRTIQALVLGPEAYQRTYGEAPELQVESFLETYDRPTLSTERRSQLADWLRTDGHTATVFTNRPSTPPPGHVDPPEAQIGAALVGLPELPIVGSGDLGWLARRENKPLYHFLKPSPVHALAALQRALGADQEPALLRALDLERAGGKRAHWQPLAGARVLAFEDSAKGLISVQRARERLAEIDIEIQVNLIGVSPHREKRAELEKVSDHLFEDLETALAALL